MNEDTINVLFSSDDNYAQHLGAAVYSLLKTNKACQRICIFVIENNISSENKNKLINVVSKFSNREIVWIPFSEWRDRLSLQMEWPISISAYARLFLASMLPEDMHRVLYLDCDVIINDSLETLWNSELGENLLGAVQDYVCRSTKEAVGIFGPEPYFNSGVMLINLDKWRQNRIEEKCLDFLATHGGNVIHHDQGILNGVLKDNWTALPIRYNLMTIHFFFDMKRLIDYYDDGSAFYSESEIEKAKISPAILHYTPSFTSRPWVKNCKHPYRGQYWEALKETEWGDSKPEKDQSKWYVKLINWRYRQLPF